MVCQQMLLWKVTRKNVIDSKNVEITLPEPIALTIHSDIPEKSAKQEFWIVGRMSDRVDWKSDSILYRQIKVPNPGEKILQPLPPGQYAVERINFTPQGSKSNSISMAMCERRLLSIAAGKRTDVTFDRKTGRRVEGRVRGLENLKLRYATVTIGYWGPEELFEPGGKKSRIQTHFDVIPIGPDGVFSTPPLPANQYDFDLWATLAATPEQESQPSGLRRTDKGRHTRDGRDSQGGDRRQAARDRRRRPGQGCRSQAAATGGSCFRRGRYGDQGFRDSD